MPQHDYTRSEAQFRQHRKAVTIMSLIHDQAGTLSTDMLPNRRDPPFFLEVIAMGEFELVRAFLDIERRAVAQRSAWRVGRGGDFLQIQLTQTVPDNEQDMLQALQQRAERYNIDISQVS